MEWFGGLGKLKKMKKKKDWNGIGKMVRPNKGLIFVIFLNNNKISILHKW